MTLPILDTPSENIGRFFKQAYIFILDALSENKNIPDDQPKNNVLVHW